VGSLTCFTVGHGTLAADQFLALLTGAGIASVVDVRTAPGSRRFPHFGRDQLSGWLPEGGIAYRWERDLGGFRKPRPDSPNTGLRDGAFRGYADHMQTGTFRRALDAVLVDAAERPTAVMCAESLWWRCHRRLLADSATLLLDGCEVVHLMHDGRLERHRLTDGVGREGDVLRYAG
jgi:uncharacterized protein (DUF488 family)